MAFSYWCLEKAADNSPKKRYSVLTTTLKGPSFREYTPLICTFTPTLDMVRSNTKASIGLFCVPRQGQWVNPMRRLHDKFLMTCELLFFQHEAS